MSSRLVSKYPPYLEVNLSLKLGETPTVAEKMTAMFDSGFSAEVSVPAAMVGNGRAPKAKAFADVTLADGSMASCSIYQGLIGLPELDDAGYYRRVDVFVMGDEVLVGRGLMDHFKVTLDHGRKLIVEP